MELEEPRPKPKCYTAHNMRKKIKRHYMMFLLNFFNAVIAKYYTKSNAPLELKTLKSSWLVNVSISHLTTLESTPIETVLSDNVSENGGVDFDHNKNIIDEINAETDENVQIIKNLFKMTYGQMYEDFYLNGDKETMTEKFGDMSEVKSFDALFSEIHQKILEENARFQKKLDKVAFSFFKFKPRKKKNQAKK